MPDKEILVAFAKSMKPEAMRVLKHLKWSGMRRRENVKAGKHYKPW